MIKFAFSWHLVEHPSLLDPCFTVWLAVNVLYKIVKIAQCVARLMPKKILTKGGKKVIAFPIYFITFSVSQTSVGFGPFSLHPECLFVFFLALARIHTNSDHVSPREALEKFSKGTDTDYVQFDSFN